jgi:crotonobetainyl-CoA:carnitine CoA-transferase CaiB-like acyl-CoA transferase
MLACTSGEHASELRDIVGAGLAPRAAESLNHVPPAPNIRAPDDSPHALYGTLAQELDKTFRSRDTRAWVDALLARGVPVAPCTPVASLFDDEHLCANGLWWDFEDPRWGAVRQTGALIKWDAMSQALVRRAPQLGEHSSEVLREFGIDAEASIASGVVTQAQ